MKFIYPLGGGAHSLGAKANAHSCGSENVRKRRARYGSVSACGFMRSEQFV